MSPSGGAHYYFHSVKGVKNSAGQVGLGLLADRAPCIEVDAIRSWEQFNATQTETMLAAGVCPCGAAIAHQFFPWLFKE